MSAVPADCIGNDPTCPCQDGDLCHYVADKTTPAMSAPAPEAERKTYPIMMDPANCVCLGGGWCKSCAGFYRARENGWDYIQHPGDCHPSVVEGVHTVCCRECAGTGIWPVPWINTVAEGRERDDAGCVTCKGTGRTEVALAKPDTERGGDNGPCRHRIPPGKYCPFCGCLWSLHHVACSGCADAGRFCFQPQPPDLSGFAHVTQVMLRNRPAAAAPVITLVGSTRFKDHFMAENERLTLEGNVVISLGIFGHTDHPDTDWSTDSTELKRRLDRLHFQKIDMADRIHCIDVGGYVGESTQREIEYADRLGKTVTYLSQAKPTELCLGAATAGAPATAPVSVPLQPATLGPGLTIALAGVQGPTSRNVPDPIWAAVVCEVADVTASRVRWHG